MTTAPAPGPARSRRAGTRGPGAQPTSTPPSAPASAPLTLYPTLDLDAACGLLRLTPQWTLSRIARQIAALDLHLQASGYRVSTRWTLIDTQGQASGHQDRGTHHLALAITRQGRARGLLYLACQACPDGPNTQVKTPDQALSDAYAAFIRSQKP